MKKLILFYLLTSGQLYAQSSFFVGISGNYILPSIYNKEDANAGRYLMQTEKSTANYGIILGYRVGDKFEISLAPNVVNFKIRYTGDQPDSSSGIRSLRAMLNFNYIDMPLMINYPIILRGKFQINVGAGLNIGYMNKYTLDEYIVPYIFNPGYENVHFWVSGLDQVYEIYKFGDTTTVKTNKPLFKKINLGVNLNLGIAYHLGNHFKIRFDIKSQYGLSDIENKTDIRFQYSENYPKKEQTINVYEVGSYRRFYYRPPSEFGKRPSTHTYYIGAGLSLIYYVNKPKKSNYQ